MFDILAEDKTLDDSVVIISHNMAAKKPKPCFVSKQYAPDRDNYIICIILCHSVKHIPQTLM